MAPGLVDDIAQLLDGPRRSRWLLQLPVEYQNAERNFIRALPLK